MLKPAILYKDELEKLFAEHIYDEDFRFYTGYRYCFSLPELDVQDNHVRYAIVEPEEYTLVGDMIAKSKNEKIIGYLAYYIDDTNDTVCNFGLYSFDKGNAIVGRDLFVEMERLVNAHRRITWRCIGDNPVARSYDKFCEKHNGNKVILHSVTKNTDGQYVDEYIYEIVH